MTDLLANLEARFRNKAIGEAYRLLARLPGCKSKAKALDLCKVYLPQISGKAGSARPRIGTHPLAKMLLTRPRPDRPRVDDLDTLRGWTLVAALRCCADCNLDDRHSRILVGLRVVRLMVQGKYRFDPLDDLRPLTGTSADVLRAVQEMQKKLETRGDETATRIPALLCLLRDIDGAAQPRFMDPLPRAEHPPEAWEEVRRDDGLTYVIGPTAEELPEGETYAPEENAEDAEVLLYDFGLGEAEDAHQAATALQTEFAFLQHLDQDKGWSADYAALSQYECGLICSAAWREITSPKPDPGAIWCAASLLFGRAICDLAGYDVSPKTPQKGQSWWKMAEGRAALCFAPDVSRLTRKQVAGNTVVMTAPDPLSRRLAAVLAEGTQTAQEDARRWLGQVGLQRAPDLRRLSRALSDGLLAAGEDIAIAGLLCGRRVAELTQLYYASFPIKRLEDAWGRVQRDWFGAHEVGQLSGMMKRPHRIGSRSAPRPGEVTAYFQRLVDDVEANRANDAPQSPWQIMDRVAVETNLVAAVLTFLTARRPHGPVFEPLSQIIGLTCPRVRLGGKGNRDVDDGRWVPLVPAALQAIDIWTECVTNLSQTRVFMLNPDLPAYIQRARAGNVPPLFAWKDLADPPVPLMAADLGTRVRYPSLSLRGKAASTDTPPNWARHYMRGALSDCGVNWTLIDGFMGHGGAVSDPMRAASGASLADQDALSDALQAIWSDLGVSLPEAV